MNNHHFITHDNNQINIHNNKENPVPYIVYGTVYRGRPVFVIF